MSRRQYLRAVIDLYIEAPGSPIRASRADWAIAATLFDRAVSIERVAHAIRIATIRRRIAFPSDSDTPRVRSIAYYRVVIETLSNQECEPGYVDFIEQSYRKLFSKDRDLEDEPKTAPLQPKSRAL